MRHLTILPVLASALCAQSFTVPSALADAPGNYYDLQTFWVSPTSQMPVHEQMLWDTADIVRGNALLKSMRMRRTSVVSNQNAAGSAALSLRLSVGPNASGSAAATFASNLGAATTSVFSGTVSLPASSWQSEAAHPFEIKIPFTTSFAFAKNAGNALVADFVITSLSTGNQQTWFLDAQGKDGGKVVEELPPQPGCKFSNASHAWGVGYPGLIYPGSSFWVSYQNILPGAQGLGILGTKGSGGVWKGIPLPFDLGLVGAPGCALAVGMDVTVPLQANASGDAKWPELTIPGNPALAGLGFWEQGAFLDAGANALGVVTTSSRKFTLGTGSLPKGCRVLRGFDSPPQPTGVIIQEATCAAFDF